MKKIVILMVLCSIVLCSCKSNQEKKTSTTSTERITIHFWHPWPSVEVYGKCIDHLVDTYNKSQDKVTVIATHLPGNPNLKVISAILGGEPPDVFLLSRHDTSSFACRDSLINLDTYIKDKRFKLSDFYPVTIEESTYKSSIYSIPFQVDIRLLYYNADLFRKAGIDPNKPPKTWDDLKTYCRKLTIFDKNKRPVQLGFDTSLDYFTFGWMNGGEFIRGNKITCNEKPIVESLVWAKEFIDILGGLKEVNQMNNRDTIRQEDPFFTGKVAMRINSEGHQGSLKMFAPKMDYRICAIPSPKTGKQVTFSGGYALFIPKGARHPEASFDFIKHMASKESQVYLSTSTTASPVLSTLMTNELIKNQPYRKLIDKLMRSARIRPGGPISEFYTEIIGKAWEQTFLGILTPQQALDEAAKKVQIEFDKLK